MQRASTARLRREANRNYGPYRPPNVLAGRVTHRGGGAFSCLRIRKGTRTVAGIRRAFGLSVSDCSGVRRSPASTWGNPDCRSPSPTRYRRTSGTPVRGDASSLWRRRTLLVDVSEQVARCRQWDGIVWQTATANGGMLIPTNEDRRRRAWSKAWRSYCPLLARDLCGFPARGKRRGQ